MRQVDASAEVDEALGDDGFAADEIVLLLRKAGCQMFGTLRFAEHDLEQTVDMLKRLHSRLNPGEHAGFLFRADGDSTHFHSCILARDHAGRPWSFHVDDSPVVGANSPAALLVHLEGSVDCPARQMAPGDCLAFALDPLLAANEPGYVPALVDAARGCGSSRRGQRYLTLTHADMAACPDYLMPLQGTRSRGLSPETMATIGAGVIRFGPHAGKTLQQFWQQTQLPNGRNTYLNDRYERMLGAVSRELKSPYPSDASAARAGYHPRSGHTAMMTFRHRGIFLSNTIDGMNVNDHGARDVRMNASQLMDALGVACPARESSRSPAARPERAPTPA